MASSTVEAAKALLATNSPEASVDVLGEALAGTQEQAQVAPEAAAQPAVAPDVAHETAQDDQPVPEFDLGEPEPDDADWLDPEPDDDEDDDDEPPAAAAQMVDDDEFADPEVKRLRAELATATKRAEHFERQNAKTARRVWEKEAAKYYPLADPESITATSRRGFLRDAKAQHDRLKAPFKRFQEQERARLKEEAAQKWGPAVAAGQVPPAAQEVESKLARLRAQGASLDKRMREMI